MNIFEAIGQMGHEQLAFSSDPESGYRAIIAIHSTRLGPAVGGTRVWNYATEEEAIIDALRLARGMTYKTAAAGLPLGGGKSVIIADNTSLNREQIFRLHGRFIETFGGRYKTGEDVGTSPDDMGLIRLETSHVAGLADRSGDPSPVTAFGVFRAIQAAANHRWGSDDLRGRRVAVQGCGHVGLHLIKKLAAAGAWLVITDISPERVKDVLQEVDAEAVAPGEIYDVEADIFAPCAMGGIINDETIPRLRVEIVAGAANNQLLEERHGTAIEERGILYAPDYVANAGGVINGCIETLGWSRDETRQKVGEIYDTMLSVFRIAREDRVPTSQAADRLAERRLAQAKGS
jgi:leucine dehydrogenase